MQLHSTAVAAGYRLLAYETLPSTNTQALALAGGGEHGPLWITARQQTAGRGRRGSQWASPAGNLYTTLLLSDPAPAECAPESSFVSALAIHDAIVDCAPALRDELRLKWPNDILYAGRKLAGILVEGEQINQRLVIAIGIGVNCRYRPQEAAYPATDLAAVGVDISAEELFAALSGAMMRRLAYWQRGAGFAGIRADWLDRAAGIGADMRVRLPHCELFGRCQGLDERGRLLLCLADGSLQVIAAGEVFPVGMAPPDLVPATGRLG
jgi:BirA family biotin operon repressor/biotin-[acetyl-CoA-carboxylase] ligase